MQSPSRRYEGSFDPRRLSSGPFEEGRASENSETGETMARWVSGKAIGCASRRRRKKLGQEGCTMLYIVNSSAKDDGYRETQS